MTTSATDLVEETSAHLRSMSRPELNRLTSDVGTGGDTVEFDFAAGGITKGAYLSIDYEIFYVWSVTGQIATVARGRLGSAVASHATGATISVNPLFTAFGTLRALNEELSSLSSPANGLFRVATVPVTSDPVRSGYDLAGVTGILDVLGVTYSGVGPDNYYPQIRSWRLARNMPVVDFASGNALFLYDNPMPNRPIVVTVKLAYAAMTSSTTDVTATTGLHAEALDILPLGAAARLVAPREVKRSFADSAPESRVAAEVPPGTARGAAAGLLSLRNQRIKEEAARLVTAYPTLRRVV